MELTEEQIEFLNEVCGIGYWTLNSKGEVDVIGSVGMSDMKLIEIPIKFGKVGDWFNCDGNNLTTLKNCPSSIGMVMYIFDNNLTDYFKNIKEEDFKLWGNLDWYDTLQEYPFLINIAKKYIDIDLLHYLDSHPLTKIYYKD